MGTSKQRIHISFSDTDPEVASFANVDTHKSSEPTYQGSKKMSLRIPLLLLNNWILECPTVNGFKVLSLTKKKNNHTL